LQLKNANEAAVPRNASFYLSNEQVENRLLFYDVKTDPTDSMLIKRQCLDVLEYSSIGVVDAHHVKASYEYYNI
jgi:hypothetical protein